MVLNCGGTTSWICLRVNWTEIRYSATLRNRKRFARYMLIYVCIHETNEQAHFQHAVSVGSHSSLWSNPFFIPSFLPSSSFFCNHGKKPKPNPVLWFGQDWLKIQWISAGTWTWRWTSAAARQHISMVSIDVTQWKTMTIIFIIIYNNNNIIIIISIYIKLLMQRPLCISKPILSLSLIASKHQPNPLSNAVKRFVQLSHPLAFECLLLFTNARQVHLRLHRHRHQHRH